MGAVYQPEINMKNRIITLHSEELGYCYFSNMDAEIAALEAKLTKARDLKQGMIQELLTGRIRLV